MEEHEKQEIKWQVRRRQEAVKLAESLEHFVNDMMFDADSFIEQLTRCTHRTLQQSALKLIFKLIDVCGDRYDNDRSRYTDGRNELSYRMCSQIRKAMNEKSPLGDRWWNQPFI